MKIISIVAVILLLLISCKPQQDLYSKKGIEVTLVKVQPTMKGYKHFFVDAKGDTLKPQFYGKPLKLNRCYTIDSLFIIKK